MFSIEVETLVVKTYEYLCRIVYLMVVPLPPGEKPT
jgi:hypothetical protein